MPHSFWSEYTTMPFLRYSSAKDLLIPLHKSRVVFSADEMRDSGLTIGHHNDPRKHQAVKWQFLAVSKIVLAVNPCYATVEEVCHDGKENLPNL